MVPAAQASCPKCGAPRGAGEERACPKCGLSAKRMEAYAKSRDEAVPDSVAAAWEQTLTEWDKPEHHDKLLRLVAQYDSYAWAAAKYRDAKLTRPDDTLADRQLDRMRRAAEATLYASASSREEPGKSPYRATTAVLVMLIFAIIAGLIFATVLKNNKPATSGTVTPAEPVRPAQPAPGGGQ